MMIIGYVITNNNVGTDKGFWSLFPALVVKLSDLYRKYFGTIDQHGNYRWSWDYWSRQEELTHRRMTAAGEQFMSHPDYMTF